MTFPQTTALIAAVMAIFQVMLMLQVGFTRLNTQIGIGSGGNDTLERKIRVHGNLTENAPMFLLLLALLEGIGMSSTIIGVIGLVFFLVRISHAYALTYTSGPHPLRTVGAFGTVICLVGTAGTLIFQALTL
ncbi:MAG: MAPEG family protein [Cyanobacteria bacterium P01_F01_bin.42]